MGYFHKIRMNGFQGYPYTTQQPGINKMNEENAFVGYFKLPDGYSLTKVDAGPDFVTSVDQPNNRFFITPTKDRVIREMYAIDKPKIYDIKVFYQAGFGKENSAVAIGALEYSWGFNYERDAFSIENSSTVDSVSPDGQKFEHGGWEKLTLGNIKILFPDLDIYDGKNKLSLKELFDKKYELTNFKMSINTKEEILLKTKSMSFVYK